MSKERKPRRQTRLNKRKAPNALSLSAPLNALSLSAPRQKSRHSIGLAPETDLTADAWNDMGTAESAAALKALEPRQYGAFIKLIDQTKLRAVWDYQAAEERKARNARTQAKRKATLARHAAQRDADATERRAMELTRRATLTRIHQGQRDL